MRSLLWVNVLLPLFLGIIFVAALLAVLRFSVFGLLRFPLSFRHDAEIVRCDKPSRYHAADHTRLVGLETNDISPRSTGA